MAQSNSFNPSPSTSKLGKIAEVDEIALQNRERSRPSSLKSGRSGRSGSAKSNVESVGLALSFREGSLREPPPDEKFGLDLPKFCCHFLSPELARPRAAYLRIVIRVIVLTIILQWTCLPIYWSSLATSLKHTPNLTGWVVDRDGIANGIGASVRGALISTPNVPGSIGWQTISAKQAGTDEDIINEVLNEGIWVAVVVATNATTNLRTARFNGNASYDPASAITVYYAQARNEVATGTYLVPSVTNTLTNATITFATSSAQHYLAAVYNNNDTINSTALLNIAQAPQTMTPGVSFRVVNLRPYTAPVAQAVTLVGQIYLTIFGFIVTMAHSTARSYLAPYLTFYSYLALRIITPLLAYFILSLSYALVNLPYHLPFGAKYPSTQGFFTFFGIIFMGMSGFGLALEAVITALGPRFVPFFLVLLIIVNVSTTALPPELQPSIYSYGAGFMDWNIQQAIRTIIFNTNNHIVKNAGVLLAWICISICTVSVFTWISRRYHISREIRKRNSGSSHSHSARQANGVTSSTPKARMKDTVGKDVDKEARDVDVEKMKEKEKDVEGRDMLVVRRPWWRAAWDLLVWVFE